LIHFFDAQNGLVINRQRVATTNDGGETWTALPTADQPAFANDEFNILNYGGNYSAQVGDRVWVGTSNGRIYRSLDRGLHWDMVQVAGTGDNIRSIAFSDSLNGVASAPGSDNMFYFVSKLYRTSDGGTTWQPLDPAPMNEATTLAAIPGAANAYFVGAYYDVDGMAPHIARNTAALDPGAWDEPVLDSAYIISMQLVDPTTGYAVGYSGRDADQFIVGNQLWFKNYIWKWVAPQSGVAEAVAHFDCTVLPNPVRDVIQVKLQAKEQDRFELTLRNLAGNVLISSRTGSLTETQLQFDLSHLPGGMYVLQVQGTHSQHLQKITKF
jgi:hypothetical protein